MVGILCATSVALMRDERCRERFAWCCHLHLFMLPMGVIS